MADAQVVMGWLDRITNVNFGGAFLLINSAGSVIDNHGNALATPSISITQVGSPQDFVGFKQLDKIVNPQNILIPDQFSPETIFTIWNPAVPLPDDTNYNNKVIGNSIDFIGQFMLLHPNIIIDLQTLESPPVQVLPNGTFNSLADAQKAIKYMSKTIFDNWFTADGRVVDAGYISNFAVGVPINVKIDGSAAASNSTFVLYQAPASGKLSVNISCPGPNPSSVVTVDLYTTAKKAIKKIADTSGLTPDAANGANHTSSHDYIVTFKTGKNPTVTVS